MREYFLFSSPQLKPAFVKANQPFDGGRKPSNSGGDEEVQGQGGVGELRHHLPLTMAQRIRSLEGELSHPFHETVGMSSVEVRGGFKNPPITLEEISDDTTQESLEEIESWPPNKFGRGQAASSFQRSSVSTGFRPKPIGQWRLLGGAGAGGKPMKKVRPKTKGSGDGN